MIKKDYYEILGVSRNADAGEIKKPTASWLSAIIRTAIPGTGKVRPVSRKLPKPTARWGTRKRGNFTTALDTPASRAADSPVSVVLKIYFPTSEIFSRTFSDSAPAGGAGAVPHRAEVSATTWK